MIPALSALSKSLNVGECLSISSSFNKLKLTAVRMTPAEKVKYVLYFVIEFVLGELAKLLFTPLLAYLQHCDKVKRV